MCVYVCVHLHLHACFMWIDKSFCCVCVYVVCMLSHGAGAVHIYLCRFMYRCVYICTTWSRTSTGGVSFGLSPRCMLKSVSLPLGFPFSVSLMLGIQGCCHACRALVWILGSELWSPRLQATHFTCWTISLCQALTWWAISPWSRFKKKKDWHWMQIWNQLNMEVVTFFLSVKQLYWAHTEPHSGLGEWSVMAFVSLSCPHVGCWRDLISFLDAKIFCHNLNLEDAVPAAVY